MPRMRLFLLSFQPVGSTDAEFRARVEKEIEKRARVVKTAGIQPDRKGRLLRLGLQGHGGRARRHVVLRPRQASSRWQA